jgi:hypothetical protein
MGAGLMASPQGAPLFDLGRVVATPGAMALLASAGENPARLLERHASGDWGEVPPEDARENERSLKYGFRILSSYPVGGASERVWVITEAGRSSTCLLLPSEY